MTHHQLRSGAWRQNRAPVLNMFNGLRVYADRGTRGHRNWVRASLVKMFEVHGLIGLEIRWVLLVGLERANGNDPATGRCDGECLQERTLDCR